MSPVLMLADDFGGTPTPSWNLVADVQELLSYAFMRNAFAASTASAIVAGVVGYFVILRASSFAAHAIAHIGFAGAAGAVLLGVSPIAGVGVFTVGASAGMGALGKRLHGRDVVIGLVMAFALGLGSLFLSLYHGNASNAYSMLFGQVFGISVDAVWITVATAIGTLLIVGVLYRPLLFCSLDEEVAEARGVPVGAVGMAFMVVLGLAVSEAVQVSGVLLIFALLIAPAAIADRVVRRPFRAMVLSAAIAVAVTWVALAFSYYTSPVPSSFYVTAFSFTAYLIARGVDTLRTHTSARRRASAAPEAPPVAADDPSALAPHSEGPHHV